MSSNDSELRFMEIGKIKTEGYKFCIPTYQRGYRWRCEQVESLLQDIYDFDTEEKRNGAFYCLQPLVVKCSDSEKKIYEVIDGQQRLTTLELALRVIELFLQFPFSISDIQVSNKGSKSKELNKVLELIKTVPSDLITSIENDANKYFKEQAIETIFYWLKDNKKPEILKEKILNSCAFIWYEIKENTNGNDIFRRLNSGKINLDDAELIKALLLLKLEPNSEHRHKIAAEWDECEQQLQDDSFWHFINPLPDANRYLSTRMNFLIEISCRVKYNEEETWNGVQNDPYSIFSFINEQFEKSNKEIKQTCQYIWSRIKKTHELLRYFYENRNLYHYVGYLVNYKTREPEKKIGLLVSLLHDSNTQTKTEFLNTLKRECKKTVFFDDKIESVGKIKEQIENLSYEKSEHHNRIQNILLLFNLATVQNSVNSESRYPFRLNNKTEKWSLEHIHPQSLNAPDKFWDKEHKEQIITCLKQLKTPQTPPEVLEALIKAISNDDNSDDLYRAVVGAFAGVPITTIDGRLTAYIEPDHGVKNLALLAKNTNSVLSNRLFPEKRKALIDIENSSFSEETKMFIPICTIKAFFKHYSPDDTNPLIWSENDRENYLNAISQTVFSYLN